MERRKFIIGGIAGGISVAGYVYTSKYMNMLADPSRDLSVKSYEQYGPKAALAAITPNDEFYVTTKGDTPTVQADSWRLKIDGLVSQPLELSYDQLLALPSIETEMTLECISNSIGGDAISNAQWTGTLLKPLLERVRPSSAATHVALYAADGYSTGHPVGRVWNQANFLAYRMNGDPLPPQHGYPVRIFIPGKFGMKQPKWVQRIEFINHHYTGYWESQGWSDDSERWAQARFTDLQDGARLSGRNIEFAGYAIGNLDEVKSVEISLDDGHNWQPTNLFSHPSPLVWSFWKFLWVNPKPGRYTIRLRAVDGLGRVEGWDPRSIFPDGATGQQQVSITVL